MKREDKNTIIENLKKQINESNHFYLTDISKLNASDTSSLRRKCFEKDIILIVVKNTLLKRALENSEVDFGDLCDVCKDSTSIMFSDTGNVPAKLIKEFRKDHDKPVLKAAYVEESIYVGDHYLDTLSEIKSKEELLGDLILLLQSPMRNVLSALQSGSNVLTGVLKTLSEKKE
jgi:large subunit ribosomal protein L10